MNELRLIHPIYLDVPMLVSFAAALQGGLSFGADVTLEKGQVQTEAAKVSGKLGLSTLFSSLFEASVAGEMSESAEARDVEVRKGSKAHTEASIAIVLYDQLRRSRGYLAQPADSDAFGSLEPGALVEVSGTMLKNAVDTVIDQIDAISLMSSNSRDFIRGARVARR